MPNEITETTKVFPETQKKDTDDRFMEAFEETSDADTSLLDALNNESKSDDVFMDSLKKEVPQENENHEELRDFESLTFERHNDYSKIMKPSGFLRSETPPLGEDDRQRIKEETDWPDELVDSIASWEEYQVYKEAGLVYAEINGKPCLIQPNIDMDQKDEQGRTNKERMKQGLSPLTKDGQKYELHHIGQNPNSPLAELTPEQHKGNYSVLHDNTETSRIDRVTFGKERNEHWEARAGQA
jgi:hypothetical protein